jgi:pantetheine-phosphate adenylyltransferase
MSKVAIFPGSFDPFTNGHMDIVERGQHLFDEIVIALGHNANKKRYFDLDLMVNHIQEVFKDNDSVQVVIYNELTAEIAKKHGAKFLLRGLRNTTDFEYENTLAQVNKNIYSDLDTVFLITSPKFAYVSSSVIREVHRYGGDISEYLPYHLAN